MLMRRMNNVARYHQIVVDKLSWIIAIGFDATHAGSSNNYKLGLFLCKKFVRCVLVA
jgi:hypothetical protein